MRQLTLFILVSAGTIYVQHGLGPHLSVEGVIPDMTLILIVYLGLIWGGFRGAVAGFFLGFASDVLSWGVIGVGALAGTVAGGLTGAYRGNIYEKSILAPPVLAAAATVFKEGINLTVLAVASPAAAVGVYHVTRLLLIVVINAAVAVPLFLFFWWIIPGPEET